MMKMQQQDQRRNQQITWSQIWKVELLQKVLIQLVYNVQNITAAYFKMSSKGLWGSWICGVMRADSIGIKDPSIGLLFTAQ